MIFLKVKGTKSWLDPMSQRALTANLSRRLWERCKGRRGLFVTLTYRRDEFQSALDLYRTQSEQQHVPLFLRKVERYMRRMGTMPAGGLKGRWFCKLEFQRGGWVHWHLIILDVEKIPHADVTSMWGRGHVWLKRLSMRQVRYCCKYVAKGGDVPVWLYGEPPKSIKVVRVSPGFWGEGGLSCSDPAPRPPTFPAWVPIGEKIERARTVLVARDEAGRHKTVRADLGPLLVALMKGGCGVVGNERGWVAVDASWEDVDACCPAASPASDLKRAAKPRAAPPPLHLIGVHNPDAGWLPRYLNALYFEDAIEGGVA